jgi:hypothetical protein
MYYNAHHGRDCALRRRDASTVASKQKRTGYSQYRCSQNLPCVKRFALLRKGEQIHFEGSGISQSGAWYGYVLQHLAVKLVHNLAGANMLTRETRPWRKRLPSSTTRRGPSSRGSMSLQVAVGGTRSGFRRPPPRFSLPAAVGHRGEKVGSYSGLR